jgi:hypothetical protein
VGLKSCPVHLFQPFLLLNILFRTSFYALLIHFVPHNIAQHLNNSQHPRKATCTILWLVGATIFVAERQQCVPFVLLTHTRLCQQCNKYLKRCHGSTTMSYPIVALPTTWNTLKYSWKMADVLFPDFHRISSVLTNFVVDASIKFHENPSSGSHATKSSQTAFQSRN